MTTKHNSSHLLCFVIIGLCVALTAACEKRRNDEAVETKAAPSVEPLKNKLQSPRVLVSKDIVDFEGILNLPITPEKSSKIKDLVNQTLGASVEDRAHLIEALIGNIPHQEYYFHASNLAESLLTDVDWAKEWFAGFYSRAEYLGVYDGFGRSVGANRPDQILDIARSVQHQELKAKRFLEAAIGGLVAANRSDGIEKSLRLKGELADAGLDTSSVDEALLKTSDFEQLSHLLVSGEIRVRVASQWNDFVQNWASNDPINATEWVMRNKELVNDPSLFYSITTSWVQNDSLAASSWIAEMPASPERDQAIRGLVFQTASSSPDDALKWVERIQDVTLRKQQIDLVMHAARLIDPSFGR